MENDLMENDLTSQMIRLAELTKSLLQNTAELFELESRAKRLYGDIFSFELECQLHPSATRRIGEIEEISAKASCGCQLSLTLIGKANSISARLYFVLGDECKERPREVEALRVFVEKLPELVSKLESKLGRVEATVREWRQVIEKAVGANIPGLISKLQP